MRRDSFIVSERDVPPANHPHRPTQCGWCKALIGEEHEAECVSRQRSVVLRLTVEFVSTIPEAWSPETLEFVHNGNTFCASNHLEQLARGDSCVCGDPPESGIAFVREATELDERFLPWSYGWRGDEE